MYADKYVPLFTHHQVLISYAASPAKIVFLQKILAGEAA